MDTTAIEGVLTAAVARGLPGAVAMVADRGGVIGTATVGVRDLAQPAPMSLDTVFWIASMTKPVTTVAALQLVERGKLALHAPLDDLLPGLARPQVLEGFTADGTPRLRPARRPITLHDLLTHTSGFGYDFASKPLLDYMRQNGTPSIGTCQRAAFALPLLFDPGERWEYGIGIDWAGQAVEAASGDNLEAYFRQHIFAPLGMADSGFRLGASQRARKVGMHQRQADGTLASIAHEVPQQPEVFMGGGGLYATAPDYMMFLQMLLHGGRFHEAEILRPESVAMMARNQIGPLSAGTIGSALPEMAAAVEMFPGIGKKWGYGFLINEQPWMFGRSAGSLTWAGLANTNFWIDPARGIAAVLMQQLLPSGDEAAVQLLCGFERAVYDGLNE